MLTTIKKDYILGNTFFCLKPLPTNTKRYRQV